MKKYSFNVNDFNEKFQNNSEIFEQFSPQLYLDKLLIFQQLSFQEKYHYINYLCLTLEKTDIQNLRQILPQILQDQVQLKVKLLDQLEGLIELTKSKTDSSEIILNFIFPIILNLIQYDNFQIKQSASQKIITIAQQLNQEDRNKYILTKILSLAHDETNIQNQIISVQLLGSLAQIFGQDLCDQFIGFEFISMGESSQVQVRKETIINFKIISKIVSEQFFQKKLFPFYEQKCQDSEWMVREACIKIIIDVMTICDIEQQQTKLVEIFIKFINDKDKKVKLEAYKNIGPFIYSLKDNIPPQIINYYFRMLNKEIVHQFSGDEIYRICAYNFPGVLFSVGIQMWTIQLKLLKVLIQHSNKNVIYPIASSFHEICKILGPELTQKDLFPILETLFNIGDDTIKQNIVKNIFQILKMFDQPKRDRLIDIFQIFVQNNKYKWRIKKLICDQIPALLELYNKQMVFTYFLPLIFKLCTDPVQAIRFQATQYVRQLIDLFENDDDIYLNIVIQNIIGFAESKNFSQRQAFLFMMQYLLDKIYYIEKYFIQYFKILTMDPVPNIRIHISQICLQYIQNHQNNQAINEIIELLKQKQDNQIESILIKIETVQNSQNITNIDQKENNIVQNDQNIEEKEIEKNQNNKTDQIENNNIEQEENNIEQEENNKTDQVVQNNIDQEEKNENIEKNSEQEEINNNNFEQINDNKDQIDNNNIDEQIDNNNNDKNDNIQEIQQESLQIQKTNEQDQERNDISIQDEKLD